MTAKLILSAFGCPSIREIIHDILQQKAAGINYLNETPAYFLIFWLKYPLEAKDYGLYFKQHINGFII